MSDSALPPADASSLDILVVPGAVVRQYGADPTVTDAVRATGADAVLPVAPHVNVAAQRLLHAVDRPVLRTDRGMRARTISTADAELAVVATPSADALPATPADVVGTNDPTQPRVVVVSDAFDMRVVPRRQETVLDGVGDYLDRLPDPWRRETGDSTVRVTHASTRLKAGYTNTDQRGGQDGIEAGGTDCTPADRNGRWEVPVVGLGTPSGMGAAVDGDTHRLVCVTVYATGHATTTKFDPDSFGLRGVDQVGQARASTLRSQGVTDVAQLRELSVDAVADRLDTGYTTAETVATSAQALAEDRVVRTSAESLPESDPVFVDIETDGLGASVAWLVGVLNGGTDSTSYYPFRQQIPTDPAAHLEAFATWLEGMPRSRPLVAWNGYSFDFDILTEQFREHCPDRLETWQSRRTLDLLYWARNRNNAALPGRSNKLEAVARAVGWEPATNGVDGETAATVYTRWRQAATSAAPSESVSEPDWERLEAYCEDDVRALATIYEAIQCAPVRSPDSERRTTDSKQGSLSDFG